MSVLTAYRQDRQQRAALVGATLTDDSFVFSPNADGASWRPPASLTRRYRRLVTGLGIHTMLHKLRHYSATELIAAGVDLRTVAGRLGHSDGGTTLAYHTAWVREADQRANFALVNRLPTPRVLSTTSPVPDARPPSPYQAIAPELRAAIVDGTLPNRRFVAHRRTTRRHPSRRFQHRPPRHHPARPRTPHHRHPRPPGDANVCPLRPEHAHTRA